MSFLTKTPRLLIASSLLAAATALAAGDTAPRSPAVNVNNMSLDAIRALPAAFLEYNGVKFSKTEFIQQVDKARRAARTNVHSNPPPNIRAEIDKLNAQRAASNAMALSTIAGIKLRSGVSKPITNPGAIGVVGPITNPSISGVVGPLSPGVYTVIQGSGFGLSPGKVSFSLGGHSFILSPEQWYDDGILVKVQDSFGGFSDQSATIFVTTGSGAKVNITAQFVAEIVSSDLGDSPSALTLEQCSHAAVLHNLCEVQPALAYSEHFVPPGNSSDVYGKDVFKVKPLKNGWTFFGDIYGGGGSSETIRYDATFIKGQSRLLLEWHIFPGSVGGVISQPSDIFWVIGPKGVPKY